MNINPDALTQAHQLALDSGKVESGRLAKALTLVPQVVKTFTGTYTDKSRIEEYWIPGSAHTGYVVTVKDGKSVSQCTCKDSQERETTYCKHRLAIMLIIRSQQLDPTPPVGEPTHKPLDPDYRKRMLAALWPED